MKVYNHNEHATIHPELIAELQRYRDGRNFDVNEYIKQKTALLNKYMT